ncbi:MAG: ABC-F family ATP-binding cassette domain-containing protein [Spirochaetaceae bacterium]|nr:ABC-F family ATP-binding cassette domain-containing protein [Spirochaetaceae bacterium]
MNLVSIDNVSKNVKEVPLFSGVSFGIDSGEKIGFVGPNGSGKSTFLRLLLGETQPDTGTISINKSVSISVLEQRPHFDESDTLKSFLYKGTDPVLALACEYAECLKASEQKNAPESIQKKLAALTQRMEEKNAFAIEHTYESFLTELGVCGVGRGLDQKMCTMSGGMVKKAAVARTFAAASNLLLLDEPTNHLDIETIEWLEKHLSSFQGSFVLVTHDRYFLDSVCNVMLDIDRRKINKYEGNFSTYLRRRKERAEEEARHDAKRESILAVELEWLKRGPKARSLKDSHRKARIEAMLAERHEQQEHIEGFSVQGRRLGGKVLKLENITKSYDGRTIIAPFSYEFTKGERIGVIGPNGSGKSTFLDLVSARIQPDGGIVDCSVNTAFGYFDQTAKFVDRNLTVLEYMRGRRQHVNLKDGTTCSIEQFLERFLFPREMFNQQLSYLSGGELRRLQLIQILADSPNFLLFDEPTNDFDIETISLLEDFLKDFGGCILAVSHDRAFLDNVTDFLFVLDGKGNISYFAGGYADYRAYTEETKKAEQASVQAKKVEESPKKAEKPKKLSYKEKIEFDGLLDEIASLEEEKASLEALFASADFAKDGAAAEKTRRYDEVSVLIEQKTNRWEELAERAE